MAGVPAGAMREMKAVLLQRAAKTRFEEEKLVAANKNPENIKDKYEDQTDKTPKIEDQTQEVKDIAPLTDNVFVGSTQRRGSKVYRNRGWKSSQSDSVSSVGSTSIAPTLTEDAEAFDQNQTVYEIRQKTEIPQMEQQERSQYVERKFQEMFDLLAEYGADIPQM